jgi:hypothetical protein
MGAETELRDMGAVSLDEALASVALVAVKEPERFGRLGARGCTRMTALPRGRLSGCLRL